MVNPWRGGALQACAHLCGSSMPLTSTSMPSRALRGNRHVIVVDDVCVTALLCGKARATLSDNLPRAIGSN